jgi:phosphate transport system permease protein
MVKTVSSNSDGLVSLVLWGLFSLVTVVSLWMLGDILLLGLDHLSLDFVIGEPADAGRNGGIAPLIVSTLLVLAVCMAVVIPVGLATALAITEFLAPEGRWQATLLRSLDLLSAVPSIVFGLFGYAFFAIQLGLGFSILSGGLALACMALPLFVRITASALAMVPHSYRQAADALAISRVSWCARILLPQSSSGIAAATILSIGRSLAETAVLIFTAGYVMRMPDSLMDSGRTLAVHIYDLSMNVSGGDPAAGATALVLVVILVVLNLITRKVLPDRTF